MGSRLIDLGIVACLTWVVVPSARRRMAAPLIAVGAVTLSMLVLVGQLVSVDTGNRYVARTTSSMTPAPYRVAALWGGMEGSLLLWCWMILVIGVVGLHRWRRMRPDDAPMVAVVVGTAGAAHLAILRLTASPFTREPLPGGDGRGLTAVLQDHAMLVHPPLLYLGIVALLPAFAITVAGGRADRLDGAWLVETRAWLWVGWVLLGSGMVLGSNWAYRELGWGGWWAWDPVENGALLPWLVMTAALHTTGPAGRSGGFRSLTAVLVVVAAAVATAGVYVTRSGSLGSIHAFAQSDSTGRGLLGVTAATIGCGVWALSRITPAARQPFRGHHHVAIALHVGVVAAAVLVIGLGTFAPAALSLLDSGGPRAITSASFYSRLLTPLAAVGLVLMAAGPHVRGGVRVRRHALAGAAGAVAGVALALASGATGGAAPVLIALAAAAGAVTVAGTWAGHGGARPRRGRRGRVALAHVGVALVAIGGAGAAVGADTVVGLELGESRTVGGGAVLRLDALESIDGGRFEALRATFDYDGRTVTSEVRIYADQQLPTAEAGFVRDGLGEVTVVVGAVTSDLARARVEVHERPLIQLVWVGCVVMLGGALPRRRPTWQLSGRLRRTDSRSAPARHETTPATRPT